MLLLKDINDLNLRSKQRTIHISDSVFIFGNNFRDRGAVRGNTRRGSAPAKDEFCPVCIYLRDTLAGKVLVEFTAYSTASRMVNGNGSCPVWKGTVTPHKKVGYLPFVHLVDGVIWVNDHRQVSTGCTTP